MNNHFAIGIPTLNRMDLLIPALTHYLKQFPSTKIFIIDNGRQSNYHRHQNITWLPQEKNIGVSASWNLLCKTIFTTRSAALILNDDIILHRTEKEISSLLLKNKAPLLRALPDWCAFLIRKETFYKNGPFDENFFPAYFEDSDYEYRLKINRMPCIHEPILTPAIYQNNSSAAIDSSIHPASQKCRIYYIKKWGGPPGAEKYLSPFNQNSKN